MASDPMKPRPSMRDLAREAVDRSRREQGLPPHVTDPAVLDQVASLMTAAAKRARGQA
jgi:hypothetical protein